MQTAAEQGKATSVYPSVDALAKELGVSRQTAYAGLRDGTIPAIRLGRRYLIPRAAIAKWLESAPSMQNTGR